MDTLLSKEGLLEIGFKELEVINSIAELKFFEKKSIFVILVEKGNGGYLVLKNSAEDNWILKPIITLGQLKNEYHKMADEGQLIQFFSYN
jgi:hypothetical protein